MTPQQITDSMVEFIDKYLMLDKKTGPNYSRNKQSVTFTGTNEKGEKIILEAVIRNERGTQCGRKDFFERRINERTKERLLKDKIYTTIILPKSVDSPNTKKKILTPYCQSPYLLKGITNENGFSNEEIQIINNLYKIFTYNNVKKLSPIERKLILPKSKAIVYYNPRNSNGKDLIEVNRFNKFKEHEIIPDSYYKKNKGYFWNFALKNYFPSKEEIENFKKSKKFADIQKGLHNRIRQMCNKKSIYRSFSIEAVNGKGMGLPTEYIKEQGKLFF